MALRAQKEFPPAPPRPKKGVLRAPPWPSVDKKMLRCSSWSFVALCGQKEVKVFSVAQKKVFSVALRGQKEVKVFSVPPSVDKKKLRCSPCPFVALRGQKEVKVFSPSLRGPPWTKSVFLAAPP